MSNMVAGSGVIPRDWTDADQSEWFKENGRHDAIEHLFMDGCTELLVNIVDLPPHQAVTKTHHSQNGEALQGDAFQSHDIEACSK